MTKTQKRRFDKAVAELNALLIELREEHPDANYYLAMDDLNVMSGPSHDINYHGSPRQDRVLHSGHMPYSGGGDW